MGDNLIAGLFQYAGPVPVSFFDVSRDIFLPFFLDFAAVVQI
ncbi:hypothetical protein D1BOALGB6SA_5760 [Olavius sp. associated proteobacterium Delta 1]|nr:hypothetical protein D1BOALGB6SA_5760 [Olavius sp. associated proteobacterium Delta 1]